MLALDAQLVYLDEDGSSCSRLPLLEISLWYSEEQTALFVDGQEPLRTPDDYCRILMLIN